MTISFSDVRTNLPDNLLDLQEKQQHDRESHPESEIDYLPTSVEKIDSLKNIINKFDAAEKTVTEMIDMITILDQIMIQVQRDMWIANKPIFMHRFFKSVDSVVEIGNIEKSDAIISIEKSSDDFSLSDNDSGELLKGTRYI